MGAPRKTTPRSRAQQPVVAVKSRRTRGERVIAFIERYCIVPEGDLLGQPMRLDAFQKKFILDIYDNPHGTHTALLSLARKNGKTALIAAILLAHICGPEAVRNSQIVSGAQSKEQAAVVFDLARKMVEMSDTLAKLVRITPNAKRLLGLRMNVSYKALAAEGKTAHGLSPRVAILDEVGQVKGPTDPFISAITTAQGAYDDALLIAISTQAPTDADMFSIWLDAQKNAPDPQVVSHVYSADEDCALDDPKAWAAANPALGKFRSLKDVEKQARAAVAMPSKEAEFRNLVLNQRVESSSPYIPKSIWKGCERASVKLGEKRKVHCGLDLSSVMDLTAFIAVDEETGAILPTFWLPEEGLLERQRQDRVPYKLWQEQGVLRTTPGKAIEYEYIATWLREFFDNHDVQKVGFDRYNMKFLRPWLVKANFSESELEKFVEFGQGTASMTPALRELEVRLVNQKLTHDANPCMTMCMMNARTIGESGARKLDKIRSRGRIDGAVALAMAVGVMPIAAAAEAEPKYQMLFV